MRVRRCIAIGLATLAAALAAPAGAQAGDFCVGVTGFVGCEAGYAGTGAGLQNALNAAEVDSFPGVDVVRIAAGDYIAPTPAGFNYANADPVSIVGAGQDQTELRSDGSGNGSVALDVNASGPILSQVTGLTVRGGGTAGARGARLEDVRAEDVAVRSAAPGEMGLGVELRDGSRFEDGLVANSSGFLGVDFQGAGELRDTPVTAKVGVQDVTAGDALDVERCSIVATHTGVSVGGPGVVGSVADSYVGMFGNTANGLYAYTGGILNARNMTVLGDGANRGALSSQSTAGTATLNLDSSTISGFGRELTASEGNGGNAVLNVAYTNYDGVEEIGGGDIVGGAGNVNMTPGFVRPDFVGFIPPDFHLLHSSSLIDKGNPAAPPAGSLDLDGLTRQVDGDGTGGPRRDMGAYEYQRLAPIAVLSGPSTGVPGQQLAFGSPGSRDPDPGDDITETWSFGDGGAATGESASHAYAAPGTYTVTLTVTDPEGKAAVASKQVVITAPSSPQSGPGGARTAIRDRVAPVVAGLSMSNRRFRIASRQTALGSRKAAKRGSAWRFRLSERATVRIGIERARKGKRRRWAKKGGTIVRKGLRAGRRRVAFTGRYGRAKLEPGLYRASLRAVDTAGNRSRLKRVTFRVVR